MIVLLDVGAEQILKKYFKNVAPSGGDDLTLKLFVNDVTPADEGVTYTEADGAGYAAKTLNAGSFDVATVDGITQASYALQTFTFTGPLTTNPDIYGYYVEDADGVIIYAERKDIVYTPANDGDNATVTPVFQLSYGTPT